MGAIFAPPSTVRSSRNPSTARVKVSSRALWRIAHRLILYSLSHTTKDNTLRPKTEPTLALSCVRHLCSDIRSVAASSAR